MGQDVIKTEPLSKSNERYIEELGLLQEVKELLRHAQHNPDEFIQLKAVSTLVSGFPLSLRVLRKHSILMMQLSKTLKSLVMGNSFNSELKLMSMHGFVALSSSVLEDQDLSSYETREVLSGITEITLYGPQRFQEKGVSILLSLWKEDSLSESLRSDLLLLYKKLLWSDRCPLQLKAQVLDCIINSVATTRFRGEGFIPVLLELFVDLLRYFSSYIQTQLRLLEGILLIGDRFDVKQDVHDLLFQHIQRLYNKSPFQKEEKIILMLMTYMLNIREGVDAFQETIIQNLVLAYRQIDFRSNQFVPFHNGPGLINELAFKACNSDVLDKRIEALISLVQKRFKFEKPVKRALENITQLDPRKFLDIQIFAQYVLSGYCSGTDRELRVISKLLQAF